MDGEYYQVPSEVDAPIPIFAWEVTDVVVAITVLGAAIVLRLFIPGLFGAVGVLILAKKIRSGQKRGQVQHLLWRLGLNLDTPLKRHAPKPLRLEFMK